VAFCDFCGTESGHLNLVNVGGGATESLCSMCSKDYEKKYCIYCSVLLTENLKDGGVCLGCKQVDNYKTEKKNIERSEGVDIESLSDLTHSVQFTDKDLENWISFVQTGKIKHKNSRA